MVTNRIYDVQVEDVYSGDDMVMLADLGVDGLYKRVRARLSGVDTPNAYRAKNDTEAGNVRDEVKKLIASGKCTAQVIAQRRGGWVVVLKVALADGTVVNINESLISRGYVYRGGKSEDAS